MAVPTLTQEQQQALENAEQQQDQVADQESWNQFMANMQGAFGDGGNEVVMPDGEVPGHAASEPEEVQPGILETAMQNIVGETVTNIFMGAVNVLLAPIYWVLGM